MEHDAAELYDLLAPLLQRWRGYTLLRCGVGEVQHRLAGTTWIVEAYVLATPEATEELRLYLGISNESLGERSEGPMPDPASELVQTVGADGLIYTVWLHPADPMLPGLPFASTPQRVQQEFSHLGSLVNLRMVVYRPLKRAVLRAEFVPSNAEAEAGASAAAGTIIYLKALPSGEAEKLYQQHQQLLAAGVRSAQPVGEPKHDVLVLHSGAGESLASLIRKDGAVGVSPEAIEEALDELPELIMDLSAKSSWTDRLDDFVIATQKFLPREAERVERLADQIAGAIELSHPGPKVPTHGDLYEEHLLFDPQTGRVSALLDLDSVGPGYRVDDIACLLGHIAVLETVDAAYRPWTRAVVERFYDYFRVTDEFGGADEQGLAARAAVVVLSLITTLPQTSHGHSLALRRLEIAEQLVELPAARHQRSGV